MGIKPVREEYYGVICIVVGCTVMMFDPKAVRTDGVEASVWIYAIAFFTCIFGAIFFMISGKTLKSLPPLTLLLMMSFYLWIFAAISSRIVDERVQLFSTDPQFGVFGFMDSETWVYSYFGFGLFAGLGYSACSVLALLFFSPLVVSNAFLFEPLVAQLEGYLLGLDRMPGVITLACSGLAVSGLVFFFRGSKARAEMIAIDRY
jgi:hypothetical protein